MTKLNILNLALIGLLLAMFAVERAGAVTAYQPQQVALPFLNP